MTERLQVSISLSKPLRRRLHEASSRNERSLSQEIEARLMASLDMQGTDELILLKVDRGLVAWLRAYVAGASFIGDLRATAAFFLRSQLMDALKPDHIFAAVVPHLPPDMRQHVAETPKYKDYVARRAA